MQEVHDKVCVDIVSAAPLSPCHPLPPPAVARHAQQEAREGEQEGGGDGKLQFWTDRFQASGPALVPVNSRLDQRISKNPEDTETISPLTPCIAVFTLFHANTALSFPDGYLARRTLIYILPRNWEKNLLVVGPRGFEPPGPLPRGDTWICIKAYSRLCMYSIYNGNLDVTENINYH